MNTEVNKFLPLIELGPFLSSLCQFLIKLILVKNHQATTNPTRPLTKPLKTSSPMASKPKSKSRTFSNRKKSSTRVKKSTRHWPKPNRED